MNLDGEEIYSVWRNWDSSVSEALARLRYLVWWGWLLIWFVTLHILYDDVSISFYWSCLVVGKNFYLVQDPLQIFWKAWDCVSFQNTLNLISSDSCWILIGILKFKISILMAPCLLWPQIITIGLRGNALIHSFSFRGKW